MIKKVAFWAGLALTGAVITLCLLAAYGAEVWSNPFTTPFDRVPPAAVTLPLVLCSQLTRWGRRRSPSEAEPGARSAEPVDRRELAFLLMGGAVLACLLLDVVVGVVNPTALLWGLLAIGFVAGPIAEVWPVGRRRVGRHGVPVGIHPYGPPRESPGA